jgi:hypothetical protein
MKQVVIAISCVDYKDIRRFKAQEVALQSLNFRPKELVSVISLSFVNDPKPKVLDGLDIHYLPILKRDSSVLLNNPRRLPYIKEIMDICAKTKCDVFGYVNSDVLLPPDAYQMLQMDFDAYIYSRSDIGEATIDDWVEGKFKVIYGGNMHSGADGFFFRKSWWNVNRNKFPDDLVIGETEWDTCYRLLIKKIGCRYLEARMLYHTYHDAKWDKNSPAGANNTKILGEIQKCQLS